jgi:ABC-type uncharacterized transport system substrate-binding protein
MQSRGRTRRAGFAAALAILGLLAPAAASAHPHVWVTFEIEIVYGKDKAITGFRHHWTFDNMYTTFAIQGLDKNNDGKYDRGELQELAKVNISSLKEFDYFMFPKVKGKLVDREEPRDYWLDYANGVLTLNFTLPLAAPIPASEVKDFSVSVYDPSFYVDFSPAKTNPVRLIGAPATCTPVVKSPKTDGIVAQRLGEAFFTNPVAANSVAAQYAKIISITCPVT